MLDWQAASNSAIRAVRVVLHRAGVRVRELIVRMETGDLDDTPQAEIPDPPDYKACIAAKQKTAPAPAKGQTAPTTAQFTGGAFGKDDQPLPPGTRIDAYVGSTRCGTASVRSSDDFTGYRC